jgi:ABC-2 type transport system permease protein
VNLALWKKTWSDGRWLLVSSVVLMTGFHWLFVWITSQIPLAQLRAMLDLLPSFVQRMFPVSLDQVATSAGRIALAYDHPLVLLIVTVWAIARGSDSVSGELGRGTMEMVVAQPVSRLAVLVTQAAVTACGAALLAMAAWIGTYWGIATVPLEEAVDPGRYLPAALSLFTVGFFLAGVTTFFSSLDRSRSRTIGLAGAFYALESIARIVAITVPKQNWLYNFTFFTLFDPEGLVARPERAWRFLAEGSEATPLGGLGCCAALVGMGLVCYAAAALVFSRRDLPAPL